MIDRLHIVRGHPKPLVLSRYLDGDLDAARGRALEDHIRGCEQCERVLDSLRATVAALGALPQPSSPAIADSVISALRADGRPIIGAGGVADGPGLSVVGSTSELATAARLRGQLRGALQFCCGRRQLAVTVPLALVVGVVLSLVNQGGMLLQGQFDVGMCVMCATDVLVPFLAVNTALVAIVLRSARRQGGRWAWRTRE